MRKEREFCFLDVIPWLYIGNLSCKVFNVVNAESYHDVVLDLMHQENTIDGLECPLSPFSCRMEIADNMSHYEYLAIIFSNCYDVMKQPGPTHKSIISHTLEPNKDN